MKRPSLLILASFILILLIGCGGGSGSSSGSYTTPVKITVGKVPAAFSPSENRFRAANQIPASVAQIRFTISAPDMQTITRVIAVSGQATITESFDVPVGASRQFLVESLDALGNVIFRGITVVDIGAEPITITISLENTDPVSPAFSGLLTITDITATTMMLNWTPATDNVTDQGKITYLVYMATSSGGQDFANPTFASSAGATSYTVTNLTPGTIYYFVVRAMDGHGNTDGNTVEISATTLYTADTVPPVFNGLASISDITATTMVLNWSPATDNVTNQNGIRYLIYTATSRSGQNFAAPTFTSAPGDTSFTVTNLSPTTTYYFVVRAMDESGNVDTNTVERWATTTAVIYAYKISGTITSSGGTALSGVYVSLSGSAAAATVTDASGHYSFSELANGSYTVTPYLTDYTFSPTSAPVTVNSADVTGVNFTGTANSVIPDTYAISGTVTYNGSGLAGVTVTLSGTAAASTTTDASGSYSFTGLANGNYTVTPSLSGFNFNPTSRAVTVNGANVTGMNFAATLAETYNISGTITFGGIGLAGVSVTLSGAANATTVTDASGNYSFTGLANGSYTVTPYLDGYYFTYESYPYTLGSADITVNGTDLTAANFVATVVPIYSTISGTITTSSGATLAAANVTLSGDASATTTTDTAGKYYFTGLSNGSYTVTPSLSGYTFYTTSADVTVNNADVTGVNFIATLIPVPHIISGTITDTGDPVPGVNVQLSGAASSSTQTDLYGNYSFTVYDGNYTVTPSSIDYEYTPTSRSVTVSGSNVTGLDFSQSAVVTYTISGTVADTYGYGRSGVTITVTLGGVAVTSSFTDTSGYYSCSGLANGSYVLTPSFASGYTFFPADITQIVAGADITGVNFTISP